MVHRKPEQVCQSLIEGNLRYQSALQSISRYRRLGDIDGVLLYLVGVELYRHHCRQNGLDYKGDRNDRSDDA